MNMVLCQVKLHWRKSEKKSEGRYPGVHQKLLNIKNDKTRILRLAWAQTIILNQLPYCFVESASFRLAVELSCVNEMDKSLTSHKIKHYIVEIYQSVKQKIVIEVREALAYFKYSMINMNIDLWKSSTGGYAGQRKYLGIRIYFTTAKWKCVTYFLAVREFNPCYQMRNRGLTQVMHVIVNFQTTLKCRPYIAG